MGPGAAYKAYVEQVYRLWFDMGRRRAAESSKAEKKEREVKNNRVGAHNGTCGGNVTLYLTADHTRPMMCSELAQ